MNLITLIIDLLAFLFANPLAVRNHTPANLGPGSAEPDSAYILAYTPYPERSRSPLCFKWSTDRTNWHSIGPDYGFLYSDYGRWGSQKRMINPVIMSDSNGFWHCVWELNETDNLFAHASSPDLVTWNRQTYFSGEEKDKFLSSLGKIKTGEGNIHKVAWKTVESLLNAYKAAAYDQQLYAEQAKDDPVRFAGLKPVTARITADGEKGKKISDMLVGIFFEDINYSADGGLYAELVQNRGFEYDPADKEGNDNTWNSTRGWTVNDGKNLVIDTVNPLHANNKHYIILRSGDMLMNEGFDGIAVKSGDHYNLSLFAKTVQKGKLIAELIDENNAVAGRTEMVVSSKNWKKYNAVITAAITMTNARLAITVSSSSNISLDHISLFPQKTFKGRSNGLRDDLASVIADMHPRFVRFPGGCVAHGDGLENMYRWKNTIGPPETRVPQRNLWGYHQSAGLGYYEYFQFCEDIGAEPVPVVPAGVPCQNSANHGHRFGGQQCGIPMEEMDTYIEEVLDLIEWANGNRYTTWGRKRAEAGHPEPFNLKYLGVGNEDLITDVFEERFRMIYEAVKLRYPEITVIGTVGPFSEGTDYREGWQLADELDIPMVDEHYYQPPAWFIYNQDFYDKYDRSKSTVYLGEYAAHLPGRPNNLETALAEAIHLISLERNGDIVRMASYAPLLAKEKHTQWNPDLIYFNNTEVKPTTGYYVQKMFGENSGGEYIASSIDVVTSNEKVRRRVACSIVRDTPTGDIIVKMVNMLPAEVNASLGISSLISGSEKVFKTVLTGKPDDRKILPAEYHVTAAEIKDISLQPYSLTILRIVK